jgi:hypothetical protein
VKPVDAVSVARLHGAYNLVSGVWPLVSMRTFEAVSGPKYDTWLVRAVGGLLATIGSAQLGAAASTDRDSVALARALGLGTAVTMGAVDLWYGGRGRISRVYLVDAAVEAGWVVAWLASARTRSERGRHTADCE